MNLNELNPTQIVLLTLLVSFVTSIATGIVTVSLVNQAPPVVTDTIYKVYEKTVEKVVPSEQKATIVENTKTVIVSEEDFVIEAVNKNVPSLTRVYSYLVEEDDVKNNLFSLSPEKKKKEFVGTALFFNEQGYLLAEKQSFNLAKIEESNLPENKNLSKKYFIEIDGQQVSTSLVENQNYEQQGFVFLKIDDLKDFDYQAVEKGDSDNLKLGQSVVILGGEKSNKVLTGVISNLIEEELVVKTLEKEITEENEEETQVTTMFLKGIEINQNLGATMIALVDLNGKFIGFKVNQNSFVPVKEISQYLEKIKEEAKTAESL